MGSWKVQYADDSVHAGKQMQRMIVKPETALVRPFVVCAILRGITFNQHRYKSFIDLQVDTKLSIVCRRTEAVGSCDSDEELFQSELQTVALSST